jgi:hypothetical protein
VSLSFIPQVIDENQQQHDTCRDERRFQHQIFFFGQFFYFFDSIWFIGN